MTTALKRTAFVFILGLFFLACKGPIELAMTANSDMHDNNSLKVIYVQLINDANFSDLNPENFWANDNDALTNDLVSGFKRDLFLKPGEERTIQVRLVKGANYLGLAAGYEEPDERIWRVIYPVDEVNGKTIKLTFARDRLIAEVQ